MMEDIFLLCCGYTFQESCCKNWDFSILRANCYLHIFRPFFLITLYYIIYITPTSRNNIIYVCTHTSSYRNRFWTNVTFHNIFSFHPSQSLYIWNFKCVFETISTKSQILWEDLYVCVLRLFKAISLFNAKYCLCLRLALRPKADTHFLFQMKWVPWEILMIWAGRENHMQTSKDLQIRTVQ